jgi:uncharacterized membrane protein HdeD (DUF308 family)
MKEATMENRKSNKGYSILTALIVIVVGVLLFIWPGTMIITFTKVLGGTIAAIGVLQLIRSLTDSMRNPLKTSLAICVLVFGAWVFMFPDAVSRFIPVMLGILLMVHGIDTIFTAVSARQFQLSNWLYLLIMGILTVVGGVLCIGLSAWIRDTGMMFLGAILVYDGISSLFVTAKVGRAEKKYKDFIDADYRELDDDE